MTHLIAAIPLTALAVWWTRKDYRERGRLGVPALALFAAVVQTLVLVEEEHLGRVFGAEYDAFKRRVPRYLGFRRAAQDPRTLQ